MGKEEDPDVKIRTLMRDKEKALSRKDFKEAAKCCNYLGVSYCDQEKYDEAVEAHQEELKLCQLVKDQLGTAVAHRKMGESLSMLGSWRSAVEHLREYMKIAVYLDNKEEIQRAETTLGRTYWLHYNADPRKHRSSLDKAEHYYKNALARAVKLKGGIPEKDYTQMRCRCLLNLALVYEQKCDKMGIKLIQEAIGLAKKFSFTDDLLRCQNALAGIYQKNGNYHEARDLYDDAIKSAKQLNDSTSRCEAILNKAYVFINLVDYDGARHLFKEAYHVKSHDEELKSKALKGYKLIKKVIETLREINLTQDLEAHMKLYDKLGDYCVDLGCYSVAIDYYHRELACALELDKSPEELAIIYVSIGQTYLDNDQPEEALKNYNKELECRAGNTEEEVKSHLKIIEIKILLDQSFEELEREYEFTLTKCDTDKLKRLVLKDYKYYLEQRKVASHRKLQVEKQLAELGETEEKEEEEEEEGVDQDTSKTGSDDEISDLTDDSEDEIDEEKKGKALRSRRSQKKITSTMKINEKGESALHRACIEGNMSHVVKLVEGGHDVNVRDHAGWLPIHEAANHGYAEIVDYLIKKKSLINDRGGAECGDTTPLHDACANGHVDVVRVLIRNGANVICRDIYGNTPFDLLKKRIGDGETLTSAQKKDVSMLFVEMKDLMKKAGYDFAAKNLKKAKRKHAPTDIIGKPVDNFRTTNHDRSPSSSPPRKTLKATSNSCLKGREAVDAKKEYKNVISNLRRPHDTCINLPQIKSKSRFKGLIDEREYVVDEWMINDLKPEALKDKPIRDAYEMKNLNSVKQPTRKTSPFYQKKHSNKSHSPIEEEEEEVKENDDDDDDEYDDENIREDKNHEEQDEEEAEITFDWENQTRQDSENEIGEEDEITEIPSNFDQSPYNSDGKKQSVNNKTMRDRIEKSHEKTSEHNVSPPSPSYRLSSFTPASSSSVIPPTGPSTHHPHQTTRSPSPVSVTQTQPCNQTNEKFLVTVHIEGKKFLLAVPSRSTQVSWLAEKTSERYYQMRQLKPNVSLTTQDGALLGLDDLIVDVCLDNQVYASIDSWALDPLPDRYESNCKLKSLAINLDLMFRLKLSETSGKLQLVNVFIGRSHVASLLTSLRCQKGLRILDFSFSDMVYFDKEDNLSTILSTLNDLEEISLKGTSLSSDKLVTWNRLQDCSSLINVDLSYNLLDDRCLNSLIQFITKCTSLKKIDLRFNDFSSHFFDNENLTTIIQNRNIVLLK